MLYTLNTQPPNQAPYTFLIDANLAQPAVRRGSAPAPCWAWDPATGGAAATSDAHGDRRYLGGLYTNKLCICMDSMILVDKSQWPSYVQDGSFNPSRSTQLEYFQF